VVLHRNSLGDDHQKGDLGADQLSAGLEYERGVLGMRNADFYLAV
jgi:hypothetical protein